MYNLLHCVHKFRRQALCNELEDYKEICLWLRLLAVDKVGGIIGFHYKVEC